MNESFFCQAIESLIDIIRDSLTLTLASVLYERNFDHVKEEANSFQIFSASTNVTVLYSRSSTAP